VISAHLCCFCQHRWLDLLDIARLLGESCKCNPGRAIFLFWGNWEALSVPWEWLL